MRSFRCVCLFDSLYLYLSFSVSLSRSIYALTFLLWDILIPEDLPFLSFFSFLSEQFIREIRRRLDAYFSLVLRNVRDAVRKETQLTGIKRDEGRKSIV